MVCWTLLPMAGALVLSFTRTEGNLRVHEADWVGLDNYQNALTVDQDAALPDGCPWYWHRLGGRPRDPQFYRALYNSLYFTVFAVPLELTFALLVALLLAQPLRGGALFRTIAYLPHLLGGVATLLIWSWLLNPRFGWVNRLIELVYALLDPVVGLFCSTGTADWALPFWLYSPGWCKPAVILIHTWTLGGSMLIFLAALRRVPRMYYDAAALDGAGRWGRFRHVTLPQISPVILFNATIGLLFAMQSFNESYVLEHWSQRGGLTFYVRYLYELAFEPPCALGYASALAWILFVVLFVLTLPLVWSARHWVYYAARR